MKFGSFILPILVGSTTVLPAQTPNAIVRGRVIDHATSQPMNGASVELLSEAIPIGTTSDSSGAYVLRATPGQYALRVRYVGYEELIVPEIWARAGKEVVLDVLLDLALTELAPFTVSATARTELEPLGTRTFTVEQSLRYPATFFDPVRMAPTSTGVVAVNDQANHLIIRGNSPNANNWTLEGVEIVNPNHLTNAGTASDLPTLSGGGVNMLSAQMLSTTQLHIGVLPMRFSNALGGIVDMNLRRGNDQRQEWTAQAGLIGIDLAAEGPLGKNGGASYVTNYRYSTLGLLSAMGVDLGNEVISFQDLALHIAVPLSERSELRVFGIGGMSSNEFKAVRDTTEWEFDKDGSDVTYEARSVITGMDLTVRTNGRGRWRTAVALSSTEQERERIELDQDLQAAPPSRAYLGEAKFSTDNSFSASLGGRWRYTVGGTASYRRVDGTFSGVVGAWSVRPYIGIEHFFTERLSLQVGTGYTYFDLNGSSTWEPRGVLRYRSAEQHEFSIGFGRRAMLPWYQIMRVYADTDEPINEHIGLSISDDLVISYRHSFSARSSLRAEVYYQHLSNIPATGPILIGFGSTEYLHNHWTEPISSRLGQDGVASNIGLELSYERWVANGAFWIANATVFDSNEGFLLGGNEPSRWNTGHQINLMAGKEWAKNKEDRIRTWGFSGRANYAGGLRYTSIDTESGVPQIGDPFGSRLNDTYRLDLRIYLKKDRKGHTGMWALDIQNVTNAQNEAYKYYDNRKGEVVTKYQLGIIPNLSYRIEF